MRELKETCKSALENGNCLGCSALENENFESNKNCEFSKSKVAEECLKQIKINLGVKL